MKLSYDFFVVFSAAKIHSNSEDRAQCAKVAWLSARKNKQPAISKGMLMAGCGRMVPATPCQEAGLGAATGGGKSAGWVATASRP